MTREVLDYTVTPLPLPKLLIGCGGMFFLVCDINYMKISGLGFDLKLSISGSSSNYHHTLIYQKTFNIMWWSKI